MRSLILDSTYDDAVDAGYIAFDEIRRGEAVRQVVVHDEQVGPVKVILDLDIDGRLLGIELLDVSTLVARPRFAD